MIKLTSTIFFFTIFFSYNANSVEAEIGKWKFSKEENYCLIISLPLKEEGNYDTSNRGDTYVMVYRINKSPNSVVQINAGYNYNNKKKIIMTIDNNNYELFSEGDDSAWTKNQDKEIIKAMIRGQDMIIQGTSTRGTLITDTYTLSGFTAANNKLKKDC